MVNKNRNSRNNSSSISIKLSSFKMKIDRVLSDFKLYLKRRSLKSKDMKSSKSKNSFNLSKRVVLVILGLIPLIILTLLLFKYLSYWPSTFQDNRVREVSLSQGRDTVAFFIANNSNIGYTYFDSITIIDRDFSNNLAKLYTINTNFIPPMANGYSLRSLINTVDQEDMINTYLGSLEAMLGLKVNKYLIYNRSDLKDIIQSRVSTIPVDRKLEFASKIIDMNSQINTSDVFDLLTQSSNNGDSATYLYGLTTKTFFQSFRNDILGLGLILNSESIFKDLKTDMNREELFSYFNSIGGFQLIFGYNSIMLTSFGEKFESSDDFIPNYLKLDENLNSVFRDFEVIKEQQRIEVYNSTSKSGVASILQRFIKNRGGNVIKIGNFPERYQETTVYLNLEQLSNSVATIKLLESIFGRDVRIRSISEYPNNYSGDITIVIGENYIE